MRLEVTKNTDNTRDMYLLEWFKEGESIRKITLYQESFKALEEYFKPKIKKEKRKPAPAPTIEEVREYFKSKNCTFESANKFHEYYETTGWRGANNSPILNWKAKALAVWIVEKNKIQETKKSEGSFFQR